jgi:hypothetical protein
MDPRVPGRIGGDPGHRPKTALGRESVTPAHTPGFVEGVIMQRIDESGQGWDRVLPEGIAGRRDVPGSRRFGGSQGYPGGFKEPIRTFITGTSSKRAAQDRTFEESEAGLA